MPAQAAPHASAFGEHLAERKELRAREPECREHDVAGAAVAEVPVVEASVAGFSESTVVAQERLTEANVVTHDGAVEQRRRVHRHGLLALVEAEAVDGGPCLDEVRVAGAVSHGVVQGRADADAGAREHGDLDGENVLRFAAAVFTQRGEQRAEPRRVAGVVAGEFTEVVGADCHGELYGVAVREHDLRRRSFARRRQLPGERVEVVQRGGEGVLEPWQLAGGEVGGDDAGEVGKKRRCTGGKPQKTRSKNVSGSDGGCPAAGNGDGETSHCSRTVTGSYAIVVAVPGGQTLGVSGAW
nr:unnamed protein product [Digitaria exilis]